MAYINLSVLSIDSIIFFFFKITKFFHMFFNCFSITSVSAMPHQVLEIARYKNLKKGVWKCCKMFIEIIKISSTFSKLVCRLISLIKQNPPGTSSSLLRILRKFWITFMSNIRSVFSAFIRNTVKKGSLFLIKTFFTWEFF